MKQRAILAAAVLIGAFGMAVSGQVQNGIGIGPDTPHPTGMPKVIPVIKLRDNFYALMSSVVSSDGQFSGGAVTALVTDAGVVLVDTKNPGWAPEMMAEIR